MSGLPCAASLAFISGLLAVSLSTRSAAVSIDDLARCAALAEPGLRLACYDTLSGRPPDRSAPMGQLPTSPPTTVPVPVPLPAVEDPRNFGLTPAQAHPTPAAAGPSAVQAHIAQIIQSATGFGHTIVVLDNGQTWIFTEAQDDSRLGRDDSVTIKHAALGSFMLTTPSHHSYHVRRLQ